MDAQPALSIPFGMLLAAGVSDGKGSRDLSIPFGMLLEKGG